jgi:hypothetical protein
MDIVALRTVKAEQPLKPMKKLIKEKAAQPVQAGLFDTHPGEVSTSNGQPMPVVPAPSATVDEQQDGMEEQRQIEASIRHEVLRTLADRAARFLQVRGMVRVHDSPFAASAAECAAQFCEGHYFGCIALTQDVLEAIVRHICQVQRKKQPHQAGSFEKNLAALHKKRLISDVWKTQLDQMWADRHTFLSLRPSEEAQQQQLEATARHMLTLLNELEQAFFGFAVRDGMVLPDHPEYWSIKEVGIPSGAPENGVHTATENGRTLKVTSQSFEAK